MSVSVLGAVDPSPVPGFPTPLFQPGDAVFDPNGDGIADSIPTGGNQLDLRFIDSDDPTGQSGNGLSWAAVDVWRNYDTPDEIRVGRGGRGQVVVSSSVLRYQGITIGVGVNDSGVLRATHATINTDPEVMDRDLKTAIFIGLTSQQKSNVPGSSDQEKTDSITILNAVGGTGQYTLTPRVEADGTTLARRPFIVGKAGHGSAELANTRLEAYGVVVAEEATSAARLSVTGVDGSLLSTNGMEVNEGGVFHFAGSAHACVTGQAAVLNTGSTMIVEGGECHLAGDLTIESDAVLHIRENTTLIHQGALNNQGAIVLDHGAKFLPTGSASVGTVYRAKCHAPAFVRASHDQDTTERLVA